MTQLAYPNMMQEQVAIVHRAFKHPDKIAAPGPLPVDRINLRLSLIHEEGVVELQQALDDFASGETDHPALIIDALIDTAFVSLGALVEMGLPYIEDLPVAPWASLYDPRPASPRRRAENALLFYAKSSVEYHGLLYRELKKAFEGEHRRSSQITLSLLVNHCLRVLKAADLDPTPFFDEVFRSNMSKLGPDGEPIISRGPELDGAPEGKFLKGPNYFEPDLKSIYEKQV